MKKRKKRKRRVTWYNPPYNEAVKTNIGGQFLKLIDKHFGEKRKDNLQKVLNRKTVKVGYSCTKNMGSIIKDHNRKLLDKTEYEEENSEEIKKCNCRNEKECPLSQNCVVESVVYEALVKEEHDTDGKSETSYIGSTEGTFKQRLYAHRSDMKKIESRNKTALAQHVWDMKQRGIKENIRWKILKKCKKYQCGSKMCDVCLSEKAEIIRKKKSGMSSLNIRNELMASCRHRSKFMLSNLKNKNKKENKKSIVQKRDRNDVCADQVGVKMQSKAKTDVCSKQGRQPNTTSAEPLITTNMSDDVGQHN